MKTTFILILIYGLCLSQKLTSKHFNLELSKEIYGDEAKNLKPEILKFYNCIKSKYPSTFKKSFFPEVTKSKTFYSKKTTDKTSTDYSLFWQSGGGSNNRRLELQKTFPKCIKKENIDW